MENKFAALVLAGGYSSRMLDFKPLLPLGNSKIIESTINSFRRAGVDDITVVVGHRADELTPVLDRLQVRHVFNVRYPTGMFSSILAGLRSLRPDVEAFFLLPGDMPMVRSHTIRELCRAFHQQMPDIIYPVFCGQRGHPPLIAANCLPRITAWRGAGGLRSCLAQYETTSFELAVLDQGVLLDADTPEDYQAVLAAWSRRSIPNLAECNAILSRMHVPDSVMRHGNLVSAVARNLTVRLNKAGLPLDADLTAAAGLLHDLDKGKPEHARRGARTLKRLGFAGVAAAVAVHHDLEYRRGALPDEAAVVYLADKLVRNDQVVSLDARFKDALVKYAENSEVLARVVGRKRTAEAIAIDIERILGTSLVDLLADEGAVSGCRQGGE